MYYELSSVWNGLWPCIVEKFFETTRNISQNALQTRYLLVQNGLWLPKNNFSHHRPFFLLLFSSFVWSVAKWLASSHPSVKTPHCLQHRVCAKTSPYEIFDVLKTNFLAKVLERQCITRNNGKAPPVSKVWWSSCTNFRLQKCIGFQYNERSLQWSKHSPRHKTVWEDPSSLRSNVKVKIAELQPRIQHFGSQKSEHKKCLQSVGKHPIICCLKSLPEWQWELVVYRTV